MVVADGLTFGGEGVVVDVAPRGDPPRGAGRGPGGDETGAERARTSQRLRRMLQRARELCANRRSDFCSALEL